jgi:transcriptional regulator with PAS, ATPase and Fis domain
MKKQRVPLISAEKQEDLKQQLMDTEKQAVIDALRKANGNKTRAAMLLNIDRSRFYDKLHKYDLV